MKHLVIALLSFTLATSLTSCNTVEGMGKDIKQGGQAIQNSAERNKTSTTQTSVKTTKTTAKKAPVQNANDLDINENTPPPTVGSGY